jgi:hypothetical protein
MPKNIAAQQMQSSIQPHPPHPAFYRDTALATPNNVTEVPFAILGTSTNGGTPNHRVRHVFMGA